MIRPFTLITMLLAALSGLYLFAVKHRAQLLDDQLAATAQASRLDGQRIRVLQAQWALEIDPTRLAQLAAQFTSLQPMQPDQLVAMASLAANLPPVDAPPPGANPQGGTPDLAAPPPPDLVAANGLPFPPAPPPGPANAPALPARQPAKFAAAAVAHSRAQTHSPPHLAQTRAGQTLAPPRALALAGPDGALAGPAGALTGEPMVGARLASAKIVSAVADGGGSVLGMAAELAPPQPLPETGSGN